MNMVFGWVLRSKATSMYKLIIFCSLFLLTACQFSNNEKNTKPEQKVVQHDSLFIWAAYNPKQFNIELYYKNDSGEVLNTLGNLKKYAKQKNKNLVFAMNGGMYLEDYSPQGLLVQNGKTVQTINTKAISKTNFYLKPNGVFYITNKKEAFVCTTEKFLQQKDSVLFATQSGPMLVVDSQLHKAFTQNSTSYYIRNGVGILPNGDVLFAMSTRPLNFYKFAEFFRSKGCRNALYLDGFVSRTYYPVGKWEQVDGDLSVLIGVSER
jgi:uncharacterized protein YigE (DUF2233 family)